MKGNRLNPAQGKKFQQQGIQWKSVGCKCKVTFMADHGKPFS